MAPWWRTLLLEQQRAGFKDVAGASASVVLPISDQLLTQLASERVPSKWITDLEVHAVPGDQFVVRARLPQLSFLPSVRVRVFVHRQPQFPASPVLVLQLVPEGIAALGAPFLPLVARLPPGISLEGELMTIDLPVLLGASAAARGLDFLTSLRVRTETGRTLIEIDARLPSGP
jgi:hypothetical protein